MEVSLPFFNVDIILEQSNFIKMLRAGTLPGRGRRILGDSTLLIVDAVVTGTLRLRLA